MQQAVAMFSNPWKSKSTIFWMVFPEKLYIVLDCFSKGL